IIEEDIWTKDNTKKHLNSLHLPVTPRDYQEDAITVAIKRRRALLLSPTGSGKSLMIYGLVRHYNKKTLIIVPTISLVSQMVSDFKEYSKKDKSFNVDKMVHPIYGGKVKDTDKPIVVSTWQSLYKLPKEYFSKFEVVFGDEVHLFK